MRDSTGILCMAYGSPASGSEIEEYYTHIRHGRPPSPAALADLRERYEAIGGSPLERITRAQAAALAERTELPTFVGMKHAPPFIAEGAGAAREAGIRRLIGLPLAPHFAAMSLGQYEADLQKAWPGELVFIPGFHAHSAFIETIAGLVREALAGYPADHVFFTAHSLPERILREGDGYRDRLLESCALVAARVDLPPWSFAFQSASRTGEPWLGPDLLEALAESGTQRALVCPIGFVADHLEVLYDIDVEAQAFARERGIELRRTPSLNDRPEFIAALAAIVEEAAR
ncbi:MAG: ferrochelatase [Chloroflexi bacterium]|nr:MAG: ferrochelatase [Chloroflexota bacterium]